jgi:hypothetical protein
MSTLVKQVFLCGFVELAHKSIKNKTIKIKFCFFIGRFDSMLYFIIFKLKTEF